MKKLLLILIYLPLIGFGQNLGPRNSIGIVGNFGNFSNSYIPTNAPLGLDVLIFINKNIGFFSDFKYGFGEISVGEKKPATHFYKNSNNLIFDKITSSGYTIVNLGAAYSIYGVNKNHIIVMLALGVSNIKFYEQYYSYNEYYIYDYDNRTSFNAFFGVQFQTLFHSSIKLGYDLNPRGLVFGLGHTL
jgi:hypothetical protein